MTNKTVSYVKRNWKQFNILCEITNMNMKEDWNGLGYMVGKEKAQLLV
jgi:hypothetical protein